MTLLAISGTVHSLDRKLHGHGSVSTRGAFNESSCCGLFGGVGAAMSWQRFSEEAPPTDVMAEDLASTPSSREQPEFSPVVSLRFGETLPALFMVPGGSGNAMELASTASHMAGNRQIYGLQPIASDGLSKPRDTVEEMAEYYVRYVRKLQPDGPYLLAGFSFGGLVALEMGRLLMAAGKDVALLVLLDTQPHQRFQPLGSLLAHWRERLSVYASAAAQLPPREAAPYVLYRLRHVGEDIRFRYSRYPWHRSASDPEELPPAFESSVKAIYHYRPRYYPGTITFFKSETSAKWQPYGDLRAGLAAKLDVHLVHGDHHAAVATHVETVAAELALAIERALASEGRGTCSAAVVRRSRS